MEDLQALEAELFDNYPCQWVDAIQLSSKSAIAIDTEGGLWYVCTPDPFE